MTFVDQLEVSNYRGINEMNEPLEFSDLTVLIGQNNAGKTSVLEALYTLLGGQDVVSQQDRIKRVTESYYRINTLAHNHVGTSTFTAEVQGKKVETELDGSSLSWTVDGEKYSAPAEVIYHLDIDNDTVYNMLFSPTEERQQYLNLISNEHAQIVNEGLHVEVADFLSKNVSEDYTEIYPENELLRVADEEGIPRYINIEEMGNGIIRVLPPRVLVPLYDPKLVLWDEIENSLHPKLLEDTLRWLAEASPQVVISTHSMDVLKALIKLDIESSVVLQTSLTEGRLRHREREVDELKNIMYASNEDPRYIPVVGGE